jgi:enterochelin esterase-like enzyme
MKPILALLILTASLIAADDFPITEDSKPHDGIPKGELIKATYIAKEYSLFPGTEREYQIYLPPNLDKTKPAPFMVFQDGVIYQAPTVFDNLIARKEIPALIGIFIKPGVVPAANPDALPRYNRSYEYDSVTDNYARFLIDEFLPAIKAKHGLNLSDDPNARAIAGNSSGGICAFMVAWHRPDQFRRVFTGVGTYVGIHGADQLPVLVRKYEPKPLRVYLQSGENDNNLYCGDWWLANQMMERSLTWNGYEVNHTWGTGGHNVKHASQLFPDVLRWLWKGYPSEPVKVNPRGDAKWVGGTVVGDGEWIPFTLPIKDKELSPPQSRRLASKTDGTLIALGDNENSVWSLTSNGTWKSLPIGSRMASRRFAIDIDSLHRIMILSNGAEAFHHLRRWDEDNKPITTAISSTPIGRMNTFMMLNSGLIVAAMELDEESAGPVNPFEPRDPFAPLSMPTLMVIDEGKTPVQVTSMGLRDHRVEKLCASPDQTTIYLSCHGSQMIHACKLGKIARPVDPFSSDPAILDDGLVNAQRFGILEQGFADRLDTGGLCVDTNGWLYVATSLGIQVLDQAGRVNFIIPTPKPPHDVCFGGKDLSDLFIACGDTIYKRPTKAHGYISGQMAPIKPPAPKL